MSLIRTLTLVILVSSIAIGQQTLQKNPKVSEDPAVARAQKIIASSLEVISDGETKVNPTSFRVVYKDSNEDGSGEGDLRVQLPSKIYVKSNWTSGVQFASGTKILNGKLFDRKSSLMVDGKTSNVILNFGGKEREIRNLKWEAFLAIFPLTLDSSWYVPLEFKFIGIAKSPDGEANVLQAVSKNNTVYQLLFDKKTKYLLIMNKSWESKQFGDVKFSYFFSDYKTMNGKMFPSRMVTKYNGNTTRERLTKRVEIAPNFDESLFEIKK